MSKLSLRHIYKVYPNGVKAVNDFNMEIDDQEFIVFVGPSGCGKSTTLRMIAGLEEISAGEFYIDDELMNDIEPKDRDIAMVFQNYALYPHMTVYENMAFGLRLRHIPQEIIHEKVLWAAQVLKLTEYLDRKPRALSGGQRQRVALGRAILRNPKVFLLDEPLSNLDAKLRTEMRAEIAKLHNELKTTFIYVTHDQVEAMTLGTRVVVMKSGWVQQIDSPQNLYEYPENKFVAGFIGTPQMNFFEAKLLRNKDMVNIKFEYCDNELTIPFKDLLKVKPSYLNGKKKVTVGLRCENMSLDPKVVEASPNKIKIKVSHFEELGNETLVYGDMNMQGDGFLESSTRVIVKSYHGALNLKQGDVVEAAFDISKAHFFDIDTELSILPRIPVENVFDCDISNNEVKFEGTTVVLPKAFNIQDVKEAELFVPVKAIKLDTASGIKVTIDKIEEVKGEKLLYLNLNGRTFFALANKDYSVGQEINIEFDYKELSIKKDNEDVQVALPEYDHYIAGFSNLENAKKSVTSICKTLDVDHKKYEKEEVERLETILGECGYRDVLSKLYKEKHKEALEKLKADRSYELGTGDLSKQGKKKIREKYNQLIAEENAMFNEKMNELSVANLQVDEERAMAAKAEIEELIKTHELNKEEMKAAFTVGANNNVARNKEELALKHSELQAKLAEINNEKTAALNEIAANPKGLSKDDFKVEIEKCKATYDKKINEAHIDSKVFYLNILGAHLETTSEINLKIVQALGIGVFTSNYRIEVPHDAYELRAIESSETFKATVVNVLDYGNSKYLVCRTMGQEIYILTDEEIAVGQEINVAVALKGIRIFEKKFDIRLY